MADPAAPPAASPPLEDLDNLEADLTDLAAMQEDDVEAPKSGEDAAPPAVAAPVVAALAAAAAAAAPAPTASEQPSKPASPAAADATAAVQVVSSMCLG